MRYPVFLLTLFCFFNAVNNRPVSLGGNSNIQSFDNEWLLVCYGLQSGGSRKEKPQGLESLTLDDKNGRPVSLSHDWAIEGPFRKDLEGGEIAATDNGDPANIPFSGHVPAFNGMALAIVKSRGKEMKVIAGSKGLQAGTINTIPVN